MSEQEDKHKVRKVPGLLEQHKADIMERLGVQAFDLLSPQDVARELNIRVERISDLVRQTWLAPAPGKSIGSANLYYRWRVEFVKQYKKTYQKESV